MQELGNNGSFISFLCDAGYSDRPRVGTILKISMLVSLISFCIKVCMWRSTE